MELERIITISDIVSCCTLVFTGIGGGFALLQWRFTNKVRRAEFVNSLVEKMRSDEDIVLVGQMIEYDKQWYSLEFHGSVEELKFDKFFSFFSYICYLRKNKLISTRDFEFFSYKIKRILQNSQVQNYFSFLNDFAAQQGVKMSFEYLYQYGAEHKLLPS